MDQKLGPQNAPVHRISSFDTEKVCCKGRALVRQRQVQKDMAKIQRDVAIANVVAQSNNASNIASNYVPGNASYVNVSSIFNFARFGLFSMYGGLLTRIFLEWL